MYRPVNNVMSVNAGESRAGSSAGHIIFIDSARSVDLNTSVKIICNAPYENFIWPNQ